MVEETKKLYRALEFLMGVSIGVGSSILVLLIQSFLGYETFDSATKLIPLYLGIIGGKGLVAILIYLRIRKGKKKPVADHLSQK